MSKNKKKKNFIVRTSVWGRLSIWWNLLVFLVAIPAALIVLSTQLEFEQEIINTALLIVGIFTFVFAALTLGSRIIRAVKTTYTFKGNTVVLATGHLFFKDEEIRRILYTPGMDVSVKQSLKGKIFNYGDVRVSLGYGDVGELCLKGVKKPLKAKKQILAIIDKKCSVMPEHGYTMNPYNTMYNVMGNYMPAGK